MYEAAEYLTDDMNSIVISLPPSRPKLIVADFSIKKARQIDVVDRIGREFRSGLEDYDTSSISFPASQKRHRKKRVAKGTKVDGTYTEKQGQYLSFISQFIKHHGHPPVIDDIEKHFGVTSTSVYRMLAKLEEKGFIQRTPKETRCIQILVPEDKLPQHRIVMSDKKDCSIYRKFFDKFKT
jgi:hypothetical protein